MTAAREVVVADAFGWLRDNAGRGPVVAVLPDAQEVGMDVGEWRGWFIMAARACFRASTGPTVFLQTDRKVAGTWLSKPALLEAAAEDVPGAVRPLLWHRIVLRRDVGKVDLHRPGYSHLVAYGPGRPGVATPDVFDGGRKAWRNGIGVNAARYVVAYLASQGARTIVNPFCGAGTLLAAANEAGLDAIGCEIDPERAALAGDLVL